MWETVLDRMLGDYFREGALEVTYPSGTRRRYGPASEPDAIVTLSDAADLRALVLNTEVAVGEAYMDGTLRIEMGGLDGLLGVLARNNHAHDPAWWRRVGTGLRKLRRALDQHNPMHRARANVAHHYDLSAELYDLFLDADRQYSCAYFTDPDMSLEAAQSAKKRHIAAKLALEPGMEVFEIGCGWGGMALSLAREHGVKVLGVTLSQEQHRYATARAEAEGLSERVRFELRDYRSVTGQFDRIVSVGMFEHVGVPHYGEYFDQVRDRLRPDGVALIHTIGRAAPPAATSPWIAKYIFPGGYCPALSEMVTAVEGAALYPTDVEVWRLHYAETLRHWHDRFAANEDRAEALYDARFCRMWRFYLKASEHTFRHGALCVFQVQLARHNAALPLSRDYLYAGSRAETGRVAAE